MIQLRATENIGGQTGKSISRKRACQTGINQLWESLDFSGLAANLYCSWALRVRNSFSVRNCKRAALLVL